MQESGISAERVTVTGRPVPYGRVSVSRVVHAPYAKVRKACRNQVASIVQTAFARHKASSSQHKATEAACEDVAHIHMSGWPRLKIPVVVEFSSLTSHPGSLVHLKWYAKRRRWAFPVMEADLVSWPLGDGSTNLLLLGFYRPPLGVLGRLADLSIGRHVANSTGVAFLDKLAALIEDESNETSPQPAPREPRAQAA